MPEFEVTVTFTVDAEDEDQAWKKVDHAIGDVPPNVGVTDLDTQEVDS